MRILIADDHAVVRRGLRDILTSTLTAAECGEAANAAQVLELTQKQSWDLVVLDVHMPGRGGLETLQDLRRQHPKLPVLMLSMSPEDQYALRALKAGAAGYLTKESAPEELINAARAALAGRKYITPTLAARLADSLAEPQERAPHELLSDREHLVLCRIAGGKTVSEIATDLSLSIKTISTYRTRILEKMGMRNNAELTAYAFQHRLV